MLTSLFSVRTAPRASAPRKVRGPRPLALEHLEDRCLMSADPVLDWNSVALQAAVTDHGIGAPGLQFGPTRTSRAFAIVQGAVYDAVNSIHSQYAPYLIQVHPASDASLTAAVAEAAYTTLLNLYPYQKSYFDTQLAASLQGIPTQAKIDGMAVGLTVANYILNARANDGSQVDAPGNQPPYTYNQQPGKWRADPLHPDATPLTPDWGGVTPFVVQSATQFGAPPPPPITSLAYAQAYEQVKALGSVNSTVRTDNETNIGFFWGYDVSPGLCAPVRFYNQIAEKVAEKMGNSVEDNARFFALINFAMADASITCWNDKFNVYDYWRPVTAIRENDPRTGPTGKGSGNPYLVRQGDTTWQPLGAPADNGSGTNFTPPFPSYTSGHAVIGASTFKVMEDFYHTDVIPGGLQIVSDEFNTNTVDQNGHKRPLLPRTYNFFSQMAGENAQSRVYLGIHWQFDAIEGIRSGDGIADYVYTHSLTPLHGERPEALPSMNPAGQIALAVLLENVAAGTGLHIPTGDHGDRGDDHEGGGSDLFRIVARSDGTVVLKAPDGRFSAAVDPVSPTAPPNTAAATTALINLLTAVSNPASHDIGGLEVDLTALHGDVFRVF
jgi:hypothetical protein